MDNPNTQPTPHRRLHPLVATAAGAVIIASLAGTAAITGLFPKASSSGAQTDQTQAPQVGAQQALDSAMRSSAANTAPNYGQQQPMVQQQQQQAQAPGAPRAPSPAQPQYAQPQYAQPQYAQAQSAQPQYAQAQSAQPQSAQAQYAQAQSTQPQYAQQPQQQQYAPQQQPRAAYCQSCGTVESIVTVRKQGHGTGIGAVGGAVAGGVVGNQFGSGNGRTAMTLLGALGGGLAGNSVEKHLRSETDYQVRVRMENGHTRYFTYRQPPPFQQGE